MFTWRALTSGTIVAAAQHVGERLAARQEAAARRTTADPLAGAESTPPSGPVGPAAPGTKA